MVRPFEEREIVVSPAVEVECFRALGAKHNFSMWGRRGGDWHEGLPSDQNVTCAEISAGQCGQAEIGRWRVLLSGRLWSQPAAKLVEQTCEDEQIRDRLANLDLLLTGKTVEEDRIRSDEDAVAEFLQHENVSRFEDLRNSLANGAFVKVDRMYNLNGNAIPLAAGIQASYLAMRHFNPKFKKVVSWNDYVLQATPAKAIEAYLMEGRVGPALSGLRVLRDAVGEENLYVRDLRDFRKSEIGKYGPLLFERWKCGSVEEMAKRGQKVFRIDDLAALKKVAEDPSVSKIAHSAVVVGMIEYGEKQPLLLVQTGWDAQFLFVAPEILRAQGVWGGWQVRNSGKAFEMKASVVEDVAFWIFTNADQLESRGLRGNENEYDDADGQTTTRRWFDLPIVKLADEKDFTSDCLPFLCGELEPDPND